VREQTKYTIAVFLAVIVGFLAITHQSFWIDEGVAALKAMQPDVHGWWQALRKDSDSNLQLLFQLFYLWGWEKIFGATEYALRASNTPWYALSAVALIWSFPKSTRLQFCALLLTLTNSFLWYYLSEARPYIVLFAFASITMGCLLRILQDKASATSSHWFQIFCLGVVGLCATSLIAVPWAVGAILAVSYWLGIGEIRKLLLRFRYSSCATAVALLLIAVYYVWTLYSGAPASAVGKTNPGSLVFIVYELTGLVGLGPGRLQLREAGPVAFYHFIPILSVGVLGIGALFCAAARVIVRKADRQRLIFFFLAVAFPFFLVLLAGVLGHVRMLGRHLTPLLPFVLLVLAIGLKSLFFDGRLVSRAIATIAIVASIVSALEIRFAPRHVRDDYRSAVAKAREGILSGKKVWWTAAESVANYYRAPFDSKNFIVTANISQHALANAPSPDLVCLSKPDVYDDHTVVRNYLQSHRFKVIETFPAFQIFAPDKVN
jgi:hypothetical protein